MPRSNTRKVKSAAEVLKGFGQAYPWMLPGLLLSWITGGFEFGGWSLFTPFVFAGAAKAEGLHKGMSLLRLPFHRAFSFFGIVAGVGLVFVVIGMAAYWLAGWLVPGADVPHFLGFPLFIALAWWPMTRLWLAPALPFVVHENDGREAPLAGYLWVGPGMFSGFSWTGIPGQVRKAMPVLGLVVVILAVYVFVMAPDDATGRDRLPLAVAFVMGFVLMPLTVFVWVRSARRAHDAALAYESRLDWLARGRDVAPTRLPPQALLEAGIDADDPHWIAAAIRQGADPSVKNDQGEGVLHRAANAGRSQVISTLVEQGVDPNALDHRGLAPLATAAESGEEQCIRALIAGGADPEGAGGRRPLCRAAHARRREAVEALLSSGAVVNPEGALEGEEWPLLCAARGGDARIVERLLQAGARTPADPASCRHLLSEAAESRDEALLRMILALFSDKELVAARLSEIWRYLGLLEADRPSGYRGVNNVLEETLWRIQPDTGTEQYPWNHG